MRFNEIVRFASRKTIGAGSLCLLMSASPARAQDVRTVKCRFASLETGNAMPAILALSADGAEFPIAVPTGSLSDETDCYSKTNNFSFLQAGDHQPAAIASIPENVKSAVLVFIPALKIPNTLPWRVFVVEDSPRNFPDGGAFVANFYSQDIRFVIGESKIILKPGSSVGVARPAKRDDFNMAPVAFQFLQDGNWRNASETMLRFLPNKNYVMFAYLDEASGRPRITTVQNGKLPVTVPEVVEP